MNLEERMAFHYRGGEHDYSNQHPFLREHQLYATDGFGCLEINPAAGRVGEYLTLTLTSRVGAKGIRPGNLLKLFIVGFNPFSMFTTDAAQTGLALVLALVTAAASNGEELDVRTHCEFNKREIYLR